MKVKSMDFGHLRQKSQKNLVNRTVDWSSVDKKIHGSAKSMKSHEKRPQTQPQTQKTPHSFT